MTIGERIRAKRLELNISLEELAKGIGVATQTIFKYEKDIVTNIPLSKIKAIADKLDTTPAYLMGWEEETISPLKQTLIKKIEAMTEDELQKLEQIIALVLKD